MGKRTQTLSQSFAKIDARLSRRIPPTVVIVQPGERKGCSFDSGHGFSRVSLVRAIQVKQYRAPLEGRGEKREKGRRKKRNLSPSGNNSSPFPPDVFLSYSPNDSSSGGGEEEARNHFQPTNREPLSLPLQSPFESKVFPWKSSTSYSLFPPEIGVPWHRRERILIFASN